MNLSHQLHRSSNVFASIKASNTAITRAMASSASGLGTSRLHDDRPVFIYGTAWKEDQTKRLVKEALMAGFRRVDTAAQPRHYQEHLVGEALREAYSEGIVKRDDIYVSYPGI
jgi:diketogulonate reductase-like aldo/keto reductase